MQAIARNASRHSPSTSVGRTATRHGNLNLGGRYTAASTASIVPSSPGVMFGHQTQPCVRSISTTRTAPRWSRATSTGLIAQSSLLSPPAAKFTYRTTSKSFRRNFATVTEDMSIHRSKYAAVVVGAGPAGICSVGHMLERKVGPVLWVDDEFNGGRINRAYREVPSNTKTKLFIDFAEKLAPFRQILDKTQSPNAIDALRELDQEKGTTLGNAGDMLGLLTRGLFKTPGVEIRKGRVDAASLDEHKGWTVSLSMSGRDSPVDDRSTVISDRLILCQGSSPTEHDLPVSIPGLRPLNLDTALSVSALAQHLNPSEQKTVAVIGASHSAVLVLLNLSRLAASSHPNIKVKWFTRHPLRYAEYMDGWILRDNTGLKGEAADWARENLEPGKLERSPVGKVITPIAYEKSREREAYKEHLPGCDVVVQAVGYSRDPIPHLKRGVGTLHVNYDHATGGFSDAEGHKVPGLYGAGIAWPERVTDPHGNVEYAVGFFKFMKYLQRVSCDWN